MRTTIVFVPTYPHFITILIGGERLRLFYVSGAFAAVVSDVVLDCVDYMNSDGTASFVHSTLDDFLAMYADDMGIVDFYSPEESGVPVPEDVYDYALALKLDPQDEKLHTIVPVLKYHLDRGWRE